MTGKVWRPGRVMKVASGSIVAAGGAGGAVARWLDIYGAWLAFAIAGAVLVLSFGGGMWAAHKRDKTKETTP